VVDRYATRDVDLGGASIRHGDLVRVSLGAANRDPAVFTDPDLFDVTREGLGRSLTFARGPHACLGIHLARLEARAAVSAFLDISPAPAARVIDPVSGLIFRAPERVEVTWSGAPGN
jgi:cytochrome P450